MPLIIEKPVDIDLSILNELKEFVLEEGQVTIHCICKGGDYGTSVRIWKTTYLYPHNSTGRSELVYSEGISLYPNWTKVERHGVLAFTLIFTALPATCKVFDMLEVIPQPGGFRIQDIVRNKTDVYYVEF